MKKLIILFIFSFIAILGKAQPVNLVPNHSFEDYIDFGNGAVEPKLWDLTLGSPDYFSAHYTFPFENAKTPQSYHGFQYAKSGQAYVGFIVKYISDSEIREYLQIKLKNTLIKDSLYNISFWVNLPDSFHWACEQKNIGFAFSDTMIDYPQHLHKHIDWLSPIYYSDSAWNPENKTGWEKITRRFIANGNENFLVIGNLLSDSQTQLINIGGGEKNVHKIHSYYFIDQIELYKYQEPDTILPKDTLARYTIIPNIFTPNGDGINDIWEIQTNLEIEKVNIYNRWGMLIQEWSGNDKYWNGEDADEGVYYYKITFKKENKEIIRTGSMTLLR